MANLSSKYHASHAIPGPFVKYVFGHYLAGMADLVDRLKGLSLQEPIYMTVVILAWQG